MHLDFFPWTGNHPEDVFTEPIIKNGYADSKLLSYEYAGAKPTIHHTLRQKNYLQTMGSLFTHVLNERRKGATVTSAPTFKPPPRVTLTDTKKEAWLKDLADREVPLRRLSRTIPHGIKNKILLEQCMDKKVPIERAVWLAKCVGANEIRASKRKGASGAVLSGGEAKWIRDWTISLEQFVESTISQAGEAAHAVYGKPRLMYCIRLTSSLYSEHLLDSSHYLDYILTSLENSHVAKLPVRLLVAGIYERDLLKYRRTGRRFVAALCSQLQAVHDSPDRDLYSQLINSILAKVKEVLRRHPESFVVPKVWPAARDAITACHDTLEDDVERSLAAINRRCNVLKHNHGSSAQTSEPRRRVIELLDSTFNTPFTTELGKGCWRIMKPRSELARTVIEWATSRHRPGLAKVFVATRLLRIWNRHGLDVNDSLMDFVGQAHQSAAIDRGSFFHLYSELVRSGHFSVSHYSHWLIARGGLRSKEDAAVEGPITTRLLAEIPISDLSEPVLRLRKTLLHRASFSADEEFVTIESTFDTIERLLPNIRGRSMEHELWHDLGLSNITNLSRTVKAELALRLRQAVKRCVLANEPHSNDGSPVLTFDEFALIRLILEQTEDIAMLADVLKLASTSSSASVQILAACTDTVNVQRDNLAAIGALQDLFQTLHARYRTLSVVEGSEPAVLLTSLCQLSARVPGAEATYVELSKDTARSKRRAAVEACSPVSDNMADILHIGEASLADEMEKVLYSGTSMDQTTISRLFEALTGHVEGLWSKQADGIEKYCLLLARLRSFDANYFTSLVAPWLDRTVRHKHTPSLNLITAPLIIADATTFGEVFQGCHNFLVDAAAPQQFRGKVAHETLDLVLGLSHGKHMPEKEWEYVLETRRPQARWALSGMILDTTRRIIELDENTPDGQQDTFTLLCDDKTFIEYLQQLVLSQFDRVKDVLVLPLAKAQDIRILTRLRVLLRSLLDLTTTLPTAADLDPARRIETIFGVASDLSLPFCQLAVRSVFASEMPDCAKAHGSNHSGGKLAPLQAFEKAVDQALIARNTTWTNIIPTLDIQIARHLCERAEGTFLEALPTSNHTNLENGVEIAKRMLVVVEATGYSMEGHRDHTTMLQVMDKLDTIVRHAADGDDGEKWFTTVEPWLPLILNFLVHLALALDSSKNAREVRVRLVMSLASLHLLVQSKHLGTSELRDTVFDTILMLADDMDEETRHFCIRLLTRGSVAPEQQSTPTTSGFTPSQHGYHAASTPASASATPTQSSFHMSASASNTPTRASFPSLEGASSAAITICLSSVGVTDPGLCYALSFGKDESSDLMVAQKGKMVPFSLKRWENLSEPTPMVGENDTSLSLRLFEARKT